MARLVTLRTPDESFKMQWKNAPVDVCRSHTCIYTKFESIRLVSTVESINIMPDKCVVYYTSGYYLVINP